MAVPKKRTSKAKKNARKANWKRKGYTAIWYLINTYYQAVPLQDWQVDYRLCCKCPLCPGL